jgi:hypothetical protein
VGHEQLKTLNQPSTLHEGIFGNSVSKEGGRVVMNLFAVNVFGGEATPVVKTLGFLSFCMHFRK